MKWLSIWDAIPFEAFVEVLVYLGNCTHKNNVHVYGYFNELYSIFVHKPKILILHILRLMLHILK